MFPKRCGRAPHFIRLSAARAGLIGLLAVLAGCANERGATTTSSTSQATPMHMAGVRSVIEADGLPAQLAPRDYKPGADDPREPWSPNYGSAHPARTTEAEPAPVAPASPARVIPVRYTQPIDAEDVIRRAVAAHEMRQGDQ